MKVKLGAIIAWAAAAPAFAATYELGPIADARVISIPGSYENNNYEKDFLSVYTAPGNVQRTFMRFDLANIPLGATERVQSAQLALAPSTGFGDSRGHATEIYRLTQSWTESQLTWNRRQAGVPWNEPGGDYVGRVGAKDRDPYASNSQTAAAANGWIVWDVTTLVSEWMEGVSPNFGMLLRSEDGNGLTFASRESTTTAARPKLTVSVAVGPPALQVDLDPFGEAVISWRGSNNAVLEESSSPAGTWITSVRTQAVQNGRTFVTVVSGELRRFFRLRAL